MCVHVCERETEKKARRGTHTHTHTHTHRDRERHGGREGGREVREGASALIWGCGHSYRQTHTRRRDTLNAPFQHRSIPNAQGMSV